MPGDGTFTRRDLLRRGALAAGGLAVAGSAGELVARSLAASPAPPRAPRFLSRPDLRIPSLTVLRAEQGASEDPIFIAPYNAPGEAQAGTVITDNSGQPIWENPIPHKVTTNVRVQSYRGEPVLTWWEGEIELGHGVGEYVIADTSYRTVRRVQASGHMRGDLHEFLITPRETALLTSYQVRKADLRALGGPASETVQDAIFQEIDLTDGRLLMEWHSLDHVPFEQSYYPIEHDWDYFHINSVDVDLDGDLLVSSRNTHAVYKIARDGSIVWRLGGKDSDFQMLPGSSFAWQHDARRLPDGTLTIFDNGANPAVERLSRGLVLELDEDAMTARMLRQYRHAGVLADSQGNMQTLPHGNVFVGWGEIPRVSEFDPSGRLVFDALLGRQYECYRAFRLPWSAQPADAPAVASRGSQVYASWNGATALAAWRVLSGGDPQALSPHRPVRRGGFETVMNVPARSAYAAVEALDEDGTVLGRSGTIRV